MLRTADLLLEIPWRQNPRTTGGVMRLLTDDKQRSSVSQELDSIRLTYFAGLPASEASAEKSLSLSLADTSVRATSIAKIDPK
jgi:hypothetical protein